MTGSKIQQPTGRKKLSPCPDERFDGLHTICCFTNACGRSTILCRSPFHFAAMRLKPVPGIQSGKFFTEKSNVIIDLLYEL